jgi:hypothetical protein
VYYTLDGSDPRLPGGGINPAAQSFTTAGATLVPQGSTWKYLDNGTNQGTAWRTPGFDDSAWAAGPAQLGYGDNDEATRVGFGPDSANKYITTYFRRTFDVANPSQFNTLRLRLLRDDGAVVYVNGQRVVASNFNADAPYGYQTPAPLNVANADESTFYDYAVDPSVLRPGTNTIAVEVHQSSGGSADVSFELELHGIAAPQPVTLPDGTTTLSARVRDAAGNWSALSRATYYTDAAASAANLVVTEVNYHPQAPEPALGETVSTNRDDYEFVELMNTGARRLTLAGVQFSLGIKLKFAPDAYLDPGERAVVVKNVAAFRSRYGDGPRIIGAYGGNLANNGQLTILKDARGAVLESFHYGDGGDWPNRADGGGATLEAINPAGDLNDPKNWRSSREYGGTPGAAGTGPVAGVLINEVMSDSTPPATDAVELFNPTAQAVDLGGWYLSDSASNYRKYRIPAGTTIPAGGYLTFDEQTIGFALDSAGDDVWLMRADPGTDRLTRFVDRVEFGAAADGEPFGRWPNGDADAGLYPMATTTLGAANAGPRVGPVVINEIMYAPAEGGQEFIELRNLTDAEVPLDGWRFNEGIDFTFPTDAFVPAGGYLVLAAGDADSFTAANDVPDDVPVLGGFTIGGFLNVLDNAGERLTLSRPVAGAPAGTDLASEVERVRYGAAAPWPVLPAGGGSSLSRLNSSAWADTASNWGAEADGGSPGRANFGADVATTVVGRHVFYNNSTYDGGSAAADAADDGAIAADKQAMLPGGGAPTFANITTYVRGMNGLMIDIAGRAAGAEVPLAEDFGFAVTAAGGWLPVAAAPTIAVRHGAGVNGSDRVTITFADGAIRNAWLQVTVKAGARTGLTARDVFYFGSLAGDSGDSATTLRVNALDLAAVKRALGGTTTVTGQFDFNRDGRVNALDLAVVKQNLSRNLGAMTAPVAASTSAPFSSTPVAAATVARVWDETQADLLGRAGV